MSKMRILFVDDEASVLDGLRRMLRKERGEWEMDFATSGPQALEKLAQTPFDVIVTDMQMPGMTGADLLERTVEVHPEVGRIVLSGHADEALAMRAARVAHQCLAKPTDPETLKLAVARARPHKDVVGNERIRSVVASCQRLPALPQSCAELTRLLESKHADARGVARIISRDLSMSAKILQLVNSSFFGIGRRVSSIEMAVTLLGILRVRALVLREHIFHAFEVSQPIEHFSVERLWHRSLKVAELARSISKTEGQDEDRPDQAFTAGLLHDIGLLLFACLHTDYGVVMRHMVEREMPICDAEMEILDVNHAEIGAYLLSLWGLPARIVEAVALHHGPLRIPYDGLCALTVVHVADVLISQVSEESAPDPLTAMLTPRLDIEYLQRIGLAGRLAHWKEIALEISQRPTES